MLEGASYWRNAMSTRSIVAGLALIASAAAMPTGASGQSLVFAEAGTTNCRAGPGTGYPVITRVYGGAQLQILGSQGSWYEVAAGGQRCWIAGSRLQFAQTYAPTYVAPQAYYVPPYASYPYFYGGPSISFSFGDFDRDRHRSRRDRGDRDWDWKPRKKWPKGDWGGHRDGDD
jgi:uncharacterized protein YraI